MIAMQPTRRKDVNVIVRYPPDVPRYVFGDKGRIRQSLTNLTNNAIKFTEKGHVLIDVESEELNDDEVSLRISVEDSGSNRDRQTGTPFRQIHPGGYLYHAPIRRHGPGFGYQQAVGKIDGWHHCGQEPGGRWLNVLVYPAPAVAEAAAAPGDTSNRSRAYSRADRGR